MTDNQNMTKDFSFYRPKQCNSGTFALFLIPISACLLLCLVTLISEFGKMMVIRVTITGIFIALFLVVYGKYRKAVKEENINEATYKEIIRNHVKSRYGLTIIEEFYIVRLKNRVMAEKADGEKIMIDLKPVDDGNDLMVFDGSKEVERINQ